MNSNIHSPFSCFFDSPNAGDHLAGLANAEVKLNEPYDRLLDNLENATTESAEIKGYLDPSAINTDSCLLTTGQAWGCLPFHAHVQ